MQNGMKKNKPQIGAVNWDFLIEKLKFPTVKNYFLNEKKRFHINLINEYQLFKFLYKFSWCNSNVLIKCIVHRSSIIKTRHFGQCFYRKGLIFFSL